MQQLTSFAEFFWQLDWEYCETFPLEEVAQVQRELSGNAATATFASRASCWRACVCLAE